MLHDHDNQNLQRAIPDHLIALMPSIVGQVSLQEVFASITMQTKAVEEAREIGGLFLVGLWAGVLSFRQRPR